MGKLYTIKSGDVLSQIALDNNTSEDEIMKHNPMITDRHSINPKWTIVLPTEKAHYTPTGTYTGTRPDWTPPAGWTQPAGSTSSTINSTTYGWNSAKTHIVKENDGLPTLWQIAVHYGVDFVQLKDRNPHIMNRYELGHQYYGYIYPGDVINLPTNMNDDTQVNSKVQDTSNIGNPTSTCVSTNYSNQSADVKPQQATNGGKRRKVIYLTFDDGPEPGTVEIFEALKKKAIPATFFFVGENVLATEDGTFKQLYPNSGLEPGLFKKIFDDPLFQIASHSQTQAHQFYTSYYDTGLKVDAGTLKPAANATNADRRSVLVDFELCNLAFSYALMGKADQYVIQMQKITNYGYRGDNVKKLFKDAKVEPYFRFLTARLPGTLRWRLTGKEGSKIDFIRRSADRDDEANDLYKNGYLIYGWDLEWNFSGGDSFMSRDVLKEHEEGKDGWWNYFGDNINKDRTKESVDKMFKKTQSHLDSIWDNTRFESSDDATAVILMHDRQFRHYTEEEPNKYVDQLLKFINKCQTEGYKFDVLENYKI